MEYVFFAVVALIFILAVFDLSVGVSNDAVNFMNSAIGSRAARFKTVIIIASVGVFLGAAMSNGMMEIARHGIFRPEQFSFLNLMCIFVAVMVTDVILLDVFNTLGMPTSTTVSMVFELLGATFAVSLFKLAADTTGLSMAQLLNTEKALSVILGIFLSVAIAFFFGTLVQYLTRLWFTFRYKKRLAGKVGIFGGISVTAIVYFLLLKGAKDLTFMTPEVKQWIADNQGLLLVGCLVVFTALMQLLHVLRVNVFKVVVLTGTFALAMAFAGNDLVNFIGVPLAGLSSFQDYLSQGGGDPSALMMHSLNGPSSTPLYFLLGAGAIMVVALATSKKARNVVKTSVNLSRQGSGDEMFGSSRIARRLVRWCLTLSEWVVSHTPAAVRRWIGRRLDTTQTEIEDGAAFDLVRGSVNLVLAAALIALGTSLKLPLSTTYVTFMVAMGTSLADRAWGRESAVFRITGVISVIGGWFITAGAAFIGAALLVSVMHLGGTAAILIVAILGIVVIWRRSRRRQKEEQQADTTLFQAVIDAETPAQAWTLLKLYITDGQQQFLQYAVATQRSVTEAFFADNARELGRDVSSLPDRKAQLKATRRNATLGMRRLSVDTANEYNPWFYMITNAQMSILYNLKRIAEACYEHVDNNFPRVPECAVEHGRPICERVGTLLSDTLQTLTEGVDTGNIALLRQRCDDVKRDITTECRRVYSYIHEQAPEHLGVLYVYLNLMQEQQEMLSSLRKLLRGDLKLLTDAGTPTPRP